MHSDAHFVFPRLIRLEQVVQERDQLPHTRDDRHFGFLSLCLQTDVERLDRRVVADRNNR